MGKFFFILACGLQLFHLAPPAAADPAPITVYTEHFPPYNYQNEQGELVGIATELMQQVMDHTGLEYRVKLVTWSRALRNVKTDKNALIYSIARIPERETQFEWLVPLFIDDYYLIGREEDTRPVTTDLIRAGRYTAVCLLSDISCDLLAKAGFPDKNMVRFSSPKGVMTAAEIILSGRADFYIDAFYRHKARDYKNWPKTARFRPKFLLGHLTLYLASYEGADAAMQKTIGATYEKLSHLGQYQPFNSRKQFETIDK